MNKFALKNMEKTEIIFTPTNILQWDKLFTKYVNTDSHIAFSSVSECYYSKDMCCSILACKQRKLRKYIAF